MLKYQAVTRWSSIKVMRLESGLVLSESSDTIELFKGHVRGYGYADLLYDNDTHYGLNIGSVVSVANQYQNSVHSEDGGYEKIKSILENETPTIRKAITTLLGKDSDCTLFPVMSSTKLIKIIDCMHTPIPRDDIIKEVEDYKKGTIKSWDICDRIFDSNDIQYLLDNMHDCSTYAPETSGYHNGHPGPDKSKWSYGLARMINALYPDDKELIRAVEDYCSICNG